MISLFVGIPILFVFIALFVLYIRVQKPVANPIGTILHQLCVVDFPMVLFSDQANDHICHLTPDLQREARHNQYKLIRGLVRGVETNTRLFHQVAVFEKLKIKANKSSLQYTEFENLVSRLVRDAEIGRWLLIRFKLILVTRSILNRIGVGQFGHLSRTLNLKGADILLEYKALESSMLTLCQTVKGGMYYELLIDRLGLRWGLHKSPGPTPVA